ncbi:Sialic acid TRAP transporter permease protein SiaT [Poriferisphaera corsica]|uniref:Sialic acid TRAP transporter permease protein SiaT n=1 Tax=Poriferisphaera corsica TaxID=2528020 RepID=A0A517YW28_9BACT|nr:TRAP transporter large permease [Poriferisphaera corsica]QDU34416.1 Sialic acid TRAP transporter permease protein SiaT [Poriferisphaera corsica]
MNEQSLILVISFFAMMLMNIPIAFAIGISTFLAIFAANDVSATNIISQRMAGGIESTSLLAIPFFILAGNLMGSGGMARRLIDFANSIVGRFNGGLSYVNVLTCMMFGAISGSAAAAVSSIGGFMIPEMQRKGYDRDFTVAVTTTAATTGLVIPPSNIMIVYAVAAQNVSIAAIFIAGVVPGIVMGLLIMGVCALFSLGNRTQSSDAFSIINILKSGLSAIPSLLLIVIVLGGIIGGIFSATEASAIAVAYAWLLGTVMYREISLKELPPILLKSAITTAIVFLLISTSSAMSWFLAYEQLPQLISETLINLTDSPIIIFLIINIVLLIVGTFMDMTPAVLIFTPIFLPIAMNLGMDPVQFGVMMIVNLCIGLCTPPVGTCLFIGCSVGKTSIAKVAGPMIPFFIAMILALLLTTYYAPLTMWLPGFFNQT